MLNPQSLAPGQEQYEMFNAPGRMGKPGPERRQYDYRHFDKELPLRWKLPRKGAGNG